MAHYADFTIGTPSRHPANQDGYSPVDHRYRAEYVAPTTWTIMLGFGQERIPSPFWVKDILGGRDEPQEDNLPQNSGFKWTVTGRGDTEWSTTVEGKHAFGNPRRAIPTPVEVPATGMYEITLDVTLADGSIDSVTREFRLRDFLVVGIGDSFASGQGNPDLRARPSPDQKAWCKATTLAILAEQIRVLWSDFEQLMREGVIDVVEAVPVFGKLLGRSADELADAADFVRDQVSALGGRLVSIGRDAEAALVEGVEEFGEMLGFGDGADAQDLDPRPANWQEPLAYRSYRSAQSLAAAEIESGDDRFANRVTFLPFGRTGSEIVNGLFGPRRAGDDDVSIDRWVGDRGQLAEARETTQGREIDALIVTIGINDIGFSTLVQDAILTASGEARRERVERAFVKVRKEYPAQLDKLRAAIDRDLRPRVVFITEYPVGIFKEIAEGAAPCGILGSDVPSPASGKGFNLDRNDALDYGKIGSELNAAIRAKADEFGWVLVDGIETGFDGHGYCSPRSFFVSAEESCLNQGDFEGMLHPNRDGHAIARDCIVRALRDNLRLEGTGWLEPVLHMMRSS